MRTDDFDFELPPDRIAWQPAPRPNPLTLDRWADEIVVAVAPNIRHNAVSV